MKERHLELQDKIFKLGISLIDEGNASSDYNISCLGDIFITLSTIVDNLEDIDTFSNYCSMFSAKKIIDNFDHGIDLDSIFDKIKKDIKGENYEDEDGDDESDNKNIK